MLRDASTRFVASATRGLVSYGVNVDKSIAGAARSERGIPLSSYCGLITGPRVRL